MMRSGTCIWGCFVEFTILIFDPSNITLVIGKLKGLLEAKKLSSDGFIFLWSDRQGLIFEYAYWGSCDSYGWLLESLATVYFHY